MEHICDECMAKLVKQGERSHFEVYGVCTKWTTQVCRVCGERRECVWRPDIKTVKEVTK